MCSKKAEDLNLSVFNMIIGINESKTLTKHILCGYKCKLDVRKFNSNWKWNNDNCWSKCDKHKCEKDFWNRL